MTIIMWSTLRLVSFVKPLRFRCGKKPFVVFTQLTEQGSVVRTTASALPNRTQLPFPTGGYNPL